MKRNEDILKKKCFYEEEINKKKKELENLENTIDYFDKELKQFE